MRRFLLTASMLIMGVVATFAQGWQVGEEITGKIGNPSFNEDAIAPWKFDHSTGSTTEKGGLCEIYDGDGADLYQYIELPAGMYRMECQGYYRIGTSWDFDPKTFNTDEWVDRAFIYVQNGKYNIESEEFTPGRLFETPLMPRLYPLHREKIYTDEIKEGWDKSDGEYSNVNGVEGSIWGPCSVEGTLMWFAQNLYAPVSDGNVKYNTVTFFLTEDGYVKVGVRKPEKNSADSWMVTDFKLYYEGEAGEAAELDALSQEIDMYISQLESLRDKNPGLINGKLDDEIQIYYEEYNPSTKEEYTEAKNYLLSLLELANTAVKDVAKLKAAITAAKALNSDNAEFLALIEEAETSVAEEGFVYEEAIHGWDYYAVITTRLNEARLNILKDQPADATGAKDFTALIAYPWFCNPGYEPTWDAENSVWVPNEAVMATSWSTYDDCDGTGSGKAEVVGEDGAVTKEAAPAIADLVKISSDASVVGQWYQQNNGLVIYWNDKLTCAKKWDMPKNDETRRVIAQNLADIPNGFYKLKILAQTWSNDWSAANPCKNHAFMQAGDKEVVSPNLEPGGWWGNDISQWKELETDFIEVTDGTLTIGAFDNGFAAVTGFRLYYYGETPNFQALLQPEVEKAQTAAAALRFKGDQLAVNAMLAEIPAEVTDKETYLAASETLKNANDYISKANDIANNFNAPDNFTTLAGSFDDGSAEAEFLGTAMIAAIEFGEGDNDTYEMADGINKQYTAYKQYVDYRQSIANFLTDPTVAPTVQEQNAYLAQNFATVEKIDEFMLALGTKYNIAKFATEGIDKATLDNPIEITSLLANPSFKEGPSTGWTVDGSGVATVNEYGNDEETHRPEVAELWNRGAFTFYQVVAGLPAGTYELRARATYRDGSGVGVNEVNAYNNAGGEENWENHNAVLFAKCNEGEQTSYVKAIESLKSTQNSFTRVTTGGTWEEDGTYTVEKVSFLAGTIAEEDQSEGITWTSVNEGSYPMDTKLTFNHINEDTGEDESVTYYYPASMQGFHMVCKNDPTAFNNSVQIFLSEAGNLEIGIRKNEGKSGDWVIMEDFQLFYLGTEAPVSVKEIENAGGVKATVSEVYSVSGARQNGLQKGINIVKYSDGTTRKVFVK